MSDGLSFPLTLFFLLVSPIRNEHCHIFSEGVIWIFSRLVWIVQ